MFGNAEANREAIACKSLAPASTVYYKLFTVALIIY